MEIVILETKSVRVMCLFVQELLWYYRLHYKVPPARMCNVTVGGLQARNGLRWLGETWVQPGAVLQPFLGTS